MPKNSVLQSPQKRGGTMSERGRKGGIATLERHGVHHMRVIGTAGLQAVLETRWNGDARAFRAYLSRCRWACQTFDEDLACTVRQGVMA
jgi:hypothetical protein